MGKKKAFKSPNAYVIIFMVMVFVSILSWIIPGGAYELDESGRAIAGTYRVVTSNPQGLWDICMAPIVGMIGNQSVAGAIAISLNIMLFGSFLEMMDESGAIKLYLKKITIKNQNNVHVLIGLLVVIMGIFGTVQGSYEEGFVYLLMFMPVILALGMDTIVAVMIVVFGTQGGCLASTINPFAVGIASDIAGISPGQGLVMRVIMFVVFMAVITIYICRYADKIKANPEKSPQFFRRKEDLEEFPVSEGEDLTLTKEQKSILGIFVGTFAIIIVSLIPWESLNPNWTFFVDATAWLASLPVIGMVLGTDMVPLGQWYFNEMSMLLVVASIIAGFVLHFDISKTINIIIKGAAGLVSTAFIVPLARGIQVVMDGGMITPTILHMGETTLSSFPPALFIVVSLVFYIIIASFIPSSTGLAAATMSIMSVLSRFANVPEDIMINVYLMALGMAKMIMPTSIVVMTCTSAAHIGYGQWIKSNWKFMICLFALSCGFLVVDVMMR